MVRRLREDRPGAWHHIVNRGLAQRAVFESGRDVEAFLGLLGEVSDAGLLEVHAYSFLTNHFHILARSPLGRVSRAMKAVENGYVRLFNRGRGRDGPLFRSRFWSRPLECGADWHCVRRYVDRNPVEAGLSDRSVDFRHGSAWWYARSGGPSCLRRDVVVECVGAGEAYPVEERTAGEDPLRELVRRRSRRAPLESDPLDGLLAVPTEQVVEWLRERARVADGSPGVWVLVASSCMEDALRSGGDDPEIAPSAAAMLRTFCGLTIVETAERCGVSYAAVRTEVDRHRKRLAGDPAYATAVAGRLSAALEVQFGPGGPRRSPRFPPGPPPRRRR